MSVLIGYPEAERSLMIRAVTPQFEGIGIAPRSPNSHEHSMHYHPDLAHYRRWTLRLRSPAQPVTVLIVDDQPDLADALRVLLELEGHEVQTSSGGHAALLLVQSWKPAIVILDIAMPDLDGISTARTLRSLPTTDAAVIIAHTSLGHEEVRRRDISGDFDAYCQKGISPRTLLWLMERTSPED